MGKVCKIDDDKIKAEVIRMYCEDGATLRHICVVLNITNFSIIKILGNRFKPVCRSLSIEQQKDITDLYKDGVSTDEIATIMSCNPRTILRILHMNEVEIRGVKHFFDIPIGKKFGRLTVLQKIGKRGKAQAMNWECICDCGNLTIVTTGNLLHGHTQSCGCILTEYKKSRIGNKSPSWGGGRFINKDGYVQVRDQEHKNAIGGYVLEHVKIMSEHLHRPLKKGETVHHKNGIRDDNHLGNLELWCSKHPPGQRVDDLLGFCIEILLEYFPEALTG